MIGVGGGRWTRLSSPSEGLSVKVCQRPFTHIDTPQPRMLVLATLTFASAPCTCLFSTGNILVEPQEWMLPPSKHPRPHTAHQDQQSAAITFKVTETLNISVKCGVSLSEIWSCAWITLEFSVSHMCVHIVMHVVWVMREIIFLSAAFQTVGIKTFCGLKDEASANDKTFFCG